MNEPTSVQGRNAASPAPIRNASAFGAPMEWLRSEIDQLFENFGPTSPSIFNFGRQVNAVPSPAIEFVEDEKSYKLTAELPGLTEQDIELSVAGDALTIKGEKKENSERKGRSDQRAALRIVPTKGCLAGRR